MNNSIVEVLVKDQYGRLAYHPTNKEAQTFADIAGTKTLTFDTLKRIAALGFSVRYVRDQLPEELK